MNLHALESFDRVCDKKGLHMATYLKEEEEETMKNRNFRIKEANVNKLFIVFLILEKI